MMAVFDPQILRICLIFSALESLYEIHARQCLTSKLAVKCERVINYPQFATLTIVDPASGAMSRSDKKQSS